MHPLILFLYAVCAIALYVLPAAIAFSRKKKHRWIIAAINILGGWIYGVPWLICLVWALFGLKTQGSKGLKAWPVGLGLVVALFLFGALGAAINSKKETKEVVQASATPAVQETAVGTRTATPAATGNPAPSMTPTATPVKQPAATPTPVATPKPTATPKAGTPPSPTPKQGPLRVVNKDVLGAYSKEDFTQMMDMYAIHDTDAVKQMVSEGKVIGLRKGSLVSLEDVDVTDGIVKVRPKGSATTVWIPSQFLDY